MLVTGMGGSEETSTAAGAVTGAGVGGAGFAAGGFA